jgi:hypothetical protein
MMASRLARSVHVARRQRVWLVLSLALLLALAGLRPGILHAQTPVSKADHGGGAHALFIPALMAPPASAKSKAPTGAQGDNSSDVPLLYNGGPVMRDPTNYVIIWNPPGSTFSATYQTLIERFFTDVGGTPYMQINSQWGDSTGAPVPNTNHFGGTWRDTTNAYPHAGTVADPLVGQDIRDEVDRAIAANPTWQAPGLSTMYFVYLGHNIIECFNGPANTFGCFAATDKDGNSPPAPSGNPNTVPGAGTYCAYHSSFGGKNYANMPYASDGACYSGALLQFPNGVDQDIVLSPTSHEMNEAYSDPHLDAWSDVNGAENGDKCAYTYGQLEPDGTNIVLSGKRYQLQQEWSNALVYGCIKRAGSAPQLTTTGDPTFDTVPRGTTASADILVQNTAAGDLNLLNIRLGTGAPLAFSLDPLSPRWGTIPSGESALFRVNFSPTSSAVSAGPLTTTLIIDTDQIGFETQAFSVSGTIGLPRVTISDNALDFGNVPTDNRTAPHVSSQLIIVGNTGAAPLGLTSLSPITGPNAADFTVVGAPALPVSIADGSSIGVTVQFNPSAPGARSATLNVNTNDPVTPVRAVSLAGNGLASAIQVSAAALSYVPTVIQSQAPGNPGSLQNLTVTNIGQAELIVDSMGTAAPFSAPGASVPPARFGTSDHFVEPITFMPTATGKFTGSFTVADTNAEGPASAAVTLCGEGVMRGIRVLVVDGSGTPLASVAKLQLQAHGTAQVVNVNMQNLSLVAVPTSCMAGEQRHYENQALPATGIANPKSAYYSLNVSAGGKKTSVTFTLDVAEFKTLVVTVK